MHLMVIGLSKQGNHRALAITLTALLERALEEYIASALTWPPGETEAEKERKDFFRSDAPFATFAAKTRLGFLLGLYNSVVRSDLETIRELRNAFAHSTSHIDFKTIAVEAVCARLALHRWVGTFGQLLEGKPAESLAKFGLIAQSLTGLFLQASTELELRKAMPGFGVDWKLLDPPPE
jgi:hypothetical protein